MNDTDIRDLLTRVADGVPATPVDPEPLLRRGYRRMARTAVVGALEIACAIFLAVAGVGLIRSSAPTAIPGDGGGQTTGTWTGPCADSQDGPPPSGCLGPLDVGTHTSQRFEPALTFTVPAGWNNPWDTRGAFELWTPGWSGEGEDPADPSIYVFRHPRMTLVRDPRPRVGCATGVYATPGTSAIEVATWVANHPGIATRAPSPVEVGGLTGYLLDVSIAKTWQESCPGMGGAAAVPLFDDLYLVEGNPLATMRLIVLDLPDGGNVLIAMDGDQVDVAMPVVNTFGFDVS